MPIQIMLVDDHGMIRQGLRNLLETQDDMMVVGEATTGREAVRMAAALKPDVVVMDLRMPDLNGIEATLQLRAGNPDVKVVALSGESVPRTTAEMVRAGATGYVLKDAAFDELVVAIRAVLAGRVYLSPAVAATFIEGYVAAGADGPQSVFRKLSGRERETLQLVAEGLSTKEIARRLAVSVKTVETHRRNLMEKLDIDSVAGLTKFAIREGVTSA